MLRLSLISWILVQSVHSFGPSLLPLFSLDPSYLNINHGSYGSSPRYVHDKLGHYQLLAERNPDRWFRLEVPAEMKRVRERLSTYVNCESEDLVLIDNASAAVNSILKSLRFQSNGTTILYYSVAYRMVKLTLEYVSKELFRDEQIVEIELDEQMIQNTDVLLQKTDEYLKKISNVKLVVFDHISSAPSVRFNIEQMIGFFRQRNILTLIDGAHAVGAIELDLKRIDPDFYLSNNHKWLFSHRTSCLLYVKRDLQKFIHPIITSFGYLQSFQEEFFWLGTKDYSAFLTIVDALDFRRTIATEPKIFQYNHQLAVQAGRLLAHMWNTSTLTSNEKWISTMNNIQLPLRIDSIAKLKNLYDAMVGQYNIFLPMFEFQKKFFCRISAQIYTDLNDFRTLGQLVLSAMNNQR